MNEPRRIMTLATLSLALFFAAMLPANANLKKGKAQIASEYDRVIAELIEMTEIPAPPFKEEARGKYYAKKLKEIGLENVMTDKVGNVYGLLRGTKKGKALVISAHLDTVFPIETEIKVKREGDKLLAPGIGDDTLGLSALLAWARAIKTNKIRPKHDILFVATVGEEGLGDLRGVRYLLTKGPQAKNIGAFISVDGAHAERVTHGAVGSRRYRIKFHGPGGHSYGAFGIVNPMNAMADTVRRLYRIKTPTKPKTTYSASVVSGGTSVNTIPPMIAIEFDMRSRNPKELKRLEDRLMRIIDESVEAENFARSTRNGSISAEKILIGDRPAGETPASHPLVQGAQRVIAANGYKPRLNASSTDSNMAMSLGIPALTIGTGAGGGRAHSVEEYLNIEKMEFIRGLQSSFEILLMAAELDF